MAARQSRVRFELGRMEVAGVVISTAAGLFAVFLLGIYAGRGMAERRLELDEDIVRLPAEMAPAADDGDDELTFYETLRAESRPPAAAPAAGAGPAGKRAVTEEALAPAESAPRVAAEQPEPAAPAAAREAGAPATTTGPKAEDEVPPKDAPKTETVAPAEPAAPGKARVAVALSPDPAAAPIPSTGGDWSVQVAASRDPRHAEQIRRRLASRGFDAYVVQARRGGETFHRVRVGHYPSIEQARKAAEHLRRQPGVPEAFVASQ